MQIIAENMMFNQMAKSLWSRFREFVTDIKDGEDFAPDVHVSDEYITVVKSDTLSWLDDELFWQNYMRAVNVLTV